MVIIESGVLVIWLGRGVGGMFNVFVGATIGRPWGCVW